MSASFTRILFIYLLGSIIAFAQEGKNKSAKDTIVFKEKYGLRLGGDLSKLTRSVIDDNYAGFEINGDYRLTRRWYLAGELGTEERTVIEEQLSTTAQGSYFKAGVDYNMYQNWLDMENMIYAGFRVGASTFSQTLNNYTIFNVNNQYWNEQPFVTDGEKSSGLTALWAELIIGLKVEVLNNLFIGANVQLKGLINETTPGAYDNLYIPGYNRTYDNGRIGAGYGYSLSYLIPIFKKDKVIVKDKSETEN